MLVAVAQVLSGVDPADNLEVIRVAAQEAAAEGAELVLFPEATMRSFAEPGRAPRLADVAEPLDGPWAGAVRQIAQELGVTIVVGMFTPGPAPEIEGAQARITNTLFVTGPEGDVSYDKIHLYDAFTYRESDSVAPGLTPVTFSLGGITFGLAICFDSRFPALFEHYGRLGVDAVLLSASWAGGEGKVHHWRTLTSARALDSTCYIVACDQADPRSEGNHAIDGDPTGVGYSRIVSPDGVTLAEAESGRSLIYANLSREAVREARAKIPVLSGPTFAVE